MIEPSYIESFVVGASDGSHLGLHEIPGMIAARHSDATRDEIVEACRVAMRTLVDGGFVHFRTTPAFADRPTRDDYLDVAADDIDPVIAGSIAWAPPREAQPRHWVLATAKGRSAYISEETLSL